MLVVGRNACIKAVDDVIYPTLDFFPVTAVIRLNAGKPAIGLKLANSYLDGYQIQAGEWLYHFGIRNWCLGL